MPHKNAAWDCQAFKSQNISQLYPLRWDFCGQIKKP